MDNTSRNLGREDSRKVTNRIISYIRKQVVDGTWPVGQKISSENELCKTLGVSRVSVRSAIQQFVALGTLNSIRGKGTFVISDDLNTLGIGTVQASSAKQIEDILDLRSVIEPELCARAAENYTPELIKQLEAYLEIMKENVNNAEVFVRTDFLFHEQLSNAAGNPFATEILHNIFTRMEQYQLLLNKTIGSYGGIYYHSLIISAVQSKDPDRARKMMLEHLQHSLDDLRHSSIIDPDKAEASS